MRTPMFCTAAAGVLSIASASPLKPRNNGTMVYEFTDLTPSPELNWAPCYDNFTCAYLEVPLDYANSSIGTTNIAFIKKWSQNSSAEDILVNPGGPGGSGVGYIMANLEVLETKFGPQYNYVGFDPRGVSRSGPSLDCFPGFPIARNIFDAEMFTAVDDSTESSLAKSFQRSAAFGKWCTEVLAINGTAQYAGTVAVANDMLHYIELRAKELGHPPEEAKLWYYGMSYGSVLGATYAALFPNRIGRLVIDGVVDSEDYYYNGWRTALETTDEDMKTFYKYCYEAGPELCLFHQNATSPEELEKRAIATLESLKKSPIVFADPATGVAPVIVTWQDVIAIAFSISYSPISGFPGWDLVLTGLEKGNATLAAISTMKAQILVPPTENFQDSRTLIACIDNAGRFNTSTFETYEEHIEYLFNQSYYGGPIIGSIVGPACRSVNIYPPESQLFKGIPSANKTSNPILFIGNKLDPITPLSSAKKMSSLFAGSEVITVDAVGHTTSGLCSKCLDKYTMAYMADATLPPPNTVFWLQY
ncbi:alpha/beta-hydrolase [Lindgomyces ingoldianus]|uniref:Alpha/beta-hydrolase n=1 Tax=Lindgomyces ingoldianus TaxID=673940 RepID=A0ACB6RIW2_9PLEO|nr:alpha/beta-hydrolase [Lindgomyces ingoldianus]KAF2478267.1 alpha/beta-hydrolase [Lindgomyces ingoldianus]